MSSGFNTTPKPAFLRAMQAQRWTVAGALAELVDNGFGPGRGDARRVHITHNTKARTITVLDNGRGMEAIGRLFQLGNTIGRTPGDIGLYGSGGTMAILWLARRIDVWTLRNRQVSHDCVDWSETIRNDEFPVVSDTWASSTLRNTPVDLINAGHGTLIQIQLAPERRFQPSNVQRDLATLYAPAIRQGRELTWTTIGKNGETRNLGDAVLEPTDPSNTIRFDIIVQVRDVDLSVRGAIGIIDGLPHSKSVVSIGYGPRVIKPTRDCFVSPDRIERYVGTGVAGWLDLGDGWQPYLTTTKDGMNDQPVWDLLMGHVFAKIQPLLRRVENDKLEIEFEDLALNLEQAFGGVNKVRVSVAGERKRNESGEETVGERHGTDGVDHEREPSQPAALDPAEADGEDTKKEEKAAAKILIVKQTDQQMEQKLCTATWAGDGIEVEVNVDHPAIKEALRAQPVNRLGLNLLITRDIAQEIAKPELSERIFRGNKLRLLEQLEDDADRPRLIQRWLMDGIRGDVA